MIMLIVTNSYFVVSSLPLCINIILDKMKAIKQDDDVFLTIFQILSYSNNSYNFLFYLIFSQKYRQAFTSIVFRCDSKNSSFTKEFTSIKLHHKQSLNKL